MNALYIKSPLNPKIEATVYQGHFATRHCHNNYYIDITRMKHEHDMAREVAMTIAKRYSYTKMIDTIVCLDGSEVIGSFMAFHMSRKGSYYINENKSINVVTPEFDDAEQPFFRDNLAPMVEGKNVLLLISTVKSGKTIARALDCMKKHGAVVQGIATVFSTAEVLAGLPVYSLFTLSDLPDYQCTDSESCPMCRAGKKVDAIANSYGLSKL